MRLLPPHVDVAAPTAVSVALAAGNTAAARAARAALVAAAARAARAALVAGDALAARAALVADARADAARAALVAGAALAARAALVAGDAITAIAARDANDVSFAAASRAALATGDPMLSWWGWDAPWYACYAVGARQIGLAKVEAQFEPILAAMEAGLWRYMYIADTVYWIARPTVFMDAGRRLHSATGPAFTLDSWSEYFWHGVLVDERVVMRPETLTIAEALAEKNVDVRRVMFTRIGGERLAREMPVRVIHADIDVSGHPRRLYEIEGVTGVRYLDLEDWAGQQHIGLAVPPHAQTCQDAVAWRRGAIDYDESGSKRNNWEYVPEMEG